MTPLQIGAAIIIVATIVGVAVGRYPWLRMNRATIALTGATGLIVIGAISLEGAYASLDMDTLMLLFAMMIINYNLRRAGFFQMVANSVIHNAHTPRMLLALIILASGLLSAIFLNDTICIVFTPLVIEICLAVNQRPMPYLIALVTAANIGSVATIIGNPQNMLIGTSSGIPFNVFTLYLAPVALAGLAVIWVVIMVVYRGELRGRLEKEPIAPHEPVRALLRKSMIATGIMLAGFVAGMPAPLAALTGAAILLISRRIEPEEVFHEVDWSLLVFFAGLFIVTGAIQAVGLSGMIFSVAEPIARQGIVAMAVVGVVLSNLISNVPAVLLLRPHVAQFSNPEAIWLTVAMATTLAGNTTLLASVANLIVAETARKRGVQLTFGEYLKAGPWIMVISLTLGLAWLLAVF
jgi:Na+/H+ antiporter NhaD/arsenite permease-like protein